MAAQNYYTGDASLPPHPQLQSPAPPPYTEHASPRPQPSPQMSGGLGPKPSYGRTPSPYRLPPQQQQGYPPQQQQLPPQGPQQSNYRPSQHYNQPHSSQQYPSQSQPSQVQVLFDYSGESPSLHRYKVTDDQRTAQRCMQSPYPPPNPYPPGMQRPQTFHQQPQQNLHPQQAYGSPMPSQQGGSRPPTQQRPPYDDLADRPSPNQHHHHHHTKRRSKSDTGRDTFLGAGGGAILGDVLIGPGVGTLGAAILGGLAGNKHAKDKERRRRSGSGRRSTSRDSRNGRY